MPLQPMNPMRNIVSPLFMSQKSLNCITPAVQIAALRPNPSGHPFYFYLQVLILNGFKSNHLVSAHCEGVAGALRASAEKAWVIAAPFDLCAGPATTGLEFAHSTA
jgi:hypothetical protein